MKRHRPIRLTTEADRERALEAAGWNLFNLHADDVLIPAYRDYAAQSLRGDGSAPAMSEVRALLLTDVVDSTKLSQALGNIQLQRPGVRHVVLMMAGVADGNVDW